MPSIALLTHTSAATANTTSVTTSAINTSGASLLVMVVAQWQSRTFGTISDSKSNTWSKLTARSVAGSVRETLAYVANPTIDSAQTFTYTSAGLDDYPAICVASFSNVATTTPLDQQNGGTGSGTTFQPGSVTPTQDNELLVTGLGQQSTPNTISIDSSFTVTDQQAYHSGNGNFGAALAYLVQTSAAAANPTWSETVTGFAAIGATIATFKLAPVLSIPRLLLLGVG